MDDFEARREDHVEELIDFVERHLDVSVTPWQKHFLDMMFAIPIIESPYVPDGELYILSGRQAVIIKTATPIVPYGEEWCQRGSHGSLSALPCRFCGAEL